MKLTKTFSLQLSIGLMLLFAIVISFQNCGKKDNTVQSVNNASSATTTTTLPSAAAVTVLFSKSPTYSPTTSSFLYGDTIYQKVLNLGSGGMGCAEVVGQSDGSCSTLSNFKQLSTISGWNWSAADGTWSSVLDAKTYQGMTVRGFYRKDGNTAPVIMQIDMQSVAAVSTSDVVAFYSRDAAGLLVNNDFSSTAQFYTHVKNGIVTDMWYCFFKSGDPTNFCANYIPSNDPVDSASHPLHWAQLPAENTTDGNASMLTYFNNGLAVGEWYGYLYSGNTRIGPFYLKVH